ncbi:hypothetical protein GCM10027040_27670 [Halomonas shantousis]
MANRYYDNSNEAQRLQPGTTAKAQEVDDKFDQIATGMGLVEQDTNRAIKLPAEAISQELNASAYQRRRRVVGFDQDGNLALLAGLNWRGDWAANTEYFINDVLRNPVTHNIHVVQVRHISDTTFSTANLALAINAEELEQLKADTRGLKDEALDARDLARQHRDHSREALYGSQVAQQGSEKARDASQAARDASQSAKGFSEQARDASQAARDLSQQYRDTTLEHRNAASESASSASQSATNAAGSASTADARASAAGDSASGAAKSAQAAAASEQHSVEIEERIGATTTVDFLSFELSGADLIVSFMGYADDSTFSINAAGEMEVIL